MSPARATIGATLLLLALAFGTLAGNGRELPPDARALSFTTRPTRVRVSLDGREVLVEFPSALPDGAADRAAKSLGPLLEGYSEGYGAIRFRLKEPASAELANTGAVEIVPRHETEATLDDERRLALLQARDQARNGDVAGATTRLERIAGQRPGDIEPLLTLAETDSAAGRWQHALGLYDGIGRLFPEATDVTRDRASLALQHAPTARLDAGATFGPNGERGQTATVSGELPLAEMWRAGVSLQVTHDEIRGLRRSGDATTADYGGTKLLGGLWVAHDWNSPSNTTRVNLFAAPETLGVGLKQDVTSRFGQTTFGALYHQPYWGTVMTFAANARRDQVGAAHIVPLPDSWQVQLGAGLIRYGLPGDDSVASGPTALAGVSRGLPERWMPVYGMQIRLGYRLEAEYLSHAALGRTAAGYLPLLDVRERELHSLYAETSAPFGPGTATGLFGYVYDRFGGGGPQALLRFSSGDAERLSYSAEAGLEPSLDLRPRTLFHLGGYLVWRFGGA